jgi:hypothetical protein
VTPRLARLRDAARGTPPLTLVTASLAALVSLYVVAWPFTRAHLPPITDLPFHAAAMSILRHWFDPAFHFREQFTVEFLKAPYWTMHGLGALLALVLPITAATKVASVILLLCLPAGLAVMFHGMRKSPLLGLLGLPFVWNTLTHWGFLNFMAALGLFAAVVGLALLVVDAPTRGRQIALAVALLLVFSTHIFRFPFAMAAVVGAGLVMYPATRTWRPLVAPLLPSVGVFLLWLLVRDKELSSQGMEPLKLHVERFAEVRGFLFGALTDPAELARADAMYRILGAAFIACLVGALVDPRRRRLTGRARWWAAGVTVLPVCIAAVFLVLYLTLPMQIGIWWYVYPREILAALFILVGIFPDLPRAPLWRLPVLGAIASASVAQEALVARDWAAYDASTRDFEQITRALPPAPKLGYLVWDRNDPRFKSPAFIHLPAWVQAEKGGWLSFHFVSWNAWPIRYRAPGPDVPPATPLRFEWTPERFDLATRGKFFDWFLVRRGGGPDPRFAREPGIKLVDHVGTWWLYRRDPTAGAPPG